MDGQLATWVGFQSVLGSRDTAKLCRALDVVDSDKQSL